jgi:3-oxoacyl-[acyl-carrier protein] reductase
MMRLGGKVALVTGSSKGIGEAIAFRYAQEGAAVIINGTNRSDLQKVEERIRKMTEAVLSVAADVSHGAEVERMVGKIIAHFGKIDVLVNNAGKMFYGKVEETSEEDWDRAMSINLKSVFLCSKAVIPHMQNRKKGRIINMSSTAGKTARTIAGASYAVTKAGIMYLTKRMAHDLGPHGITVNCIAPGPVDTAMARSFPAGVLESYTNTIPLGRMGVPEDVANVAFFLASDDADYVTGEVIDVNGGSYID